MAAFPLRTSVENDSEADAGGHHHHEQHEDEHCMTAGVSVQLYSLREASDADFRAVLARLGAIGFVGVETAGFHGLTGAEVRATLDAAGLVASSAHVGLAPPDDFERALDEHAALGCSMVVIPAIAPKAFADLDRIRASADLVNAANEQARARGLTLGYHNHFWELQSVISDRPALLHLFDHLDPSVVAEVDIYWAQVGGADPVALVGELGERAALLHVKDGPGGDPAQAMVAVGDGVIDVPAVIAAAPGAQWHIIELDRCDTDMFDAVERSYHYLVDHGLSRGRS
jgi:sugar phosphate isomerase/epimerase